MLNRYACDMLARIKDFFAHQKTSSLQCIAGDSRLRIFSKVGRQNPDFGKDFEEAKDCRYFCSPPYVGQIDYHEQHALRIRLAWF